MLEKKFGHCIRGRDLRSLRAKTRVKETLGITSSVLPCMSVCLFLSASLCQSARHQGYASSRVILTMLIKICWDNCLFTSYHFVITRLFFFGTISEVGQTQFKAFVASEGLGDVKVLVIFGRGCSSLC